MIQAQASKRIIIVNPVNQACVEKYDLVHEIFL